MSNKTFLGRGWSFPPVFNKESATVEMVEDELDVEQSLKLILSTRPGERVTNPDFGCAIHELMFEPIDPTTKYLIKETIRMAILYFEPRITLDLIEVDTTEELDGVINITLHYTIRKINIRRNIVFPFYKLEGTLIDEV